MTEDGGGWNRQRALCSRKMLQHNKIAHITMKCVRTVHDVTVCVSVCHSALVKDYWSDFAAIFNRSIFICQKVGSS